MRKKLLRVQPQRLQSQPHHDTDRAQCIHNLRFPGFRQGTTDLCGCKPRYDECEGCAVETAPAKTYRAHSMLQASNVRHLQAASQDDVHTHSASRRSIPNCRSLPPHGGAIDRVPNAFAGRLRLDLGDNKSAKRVQGTAEAPHVLALLEPAVQEDDGAHGTGSADSLDTAA